MSKSFALTATLATLSLILITARAISPSFAAETSKLKKEPAMKPQTISYAGITFTAPNTRRSPHHVFAQMNGKLLWEINNTVLAAPAKTGGIEKLEIKKVTDNNLDHGAADYPEKKQYVGKPALYIHFSRDSVINRLPSWDIVDVNTGKRIAFIAFN